MTNCSLIDLENMFSNGFKIGNRGITKIHSNNSTQTAQIIANVASSQYGGATVDHIDEVLAPYAEMNYKRISLLLENGSMVPKNKRPLKSVRKRYPRWIQSLEYEINTLYTSQGQTPLNLALV